MVKRLVLLAAVLGFGACTLDKQSTPALTGPSELGLSLVVSASPDAISQDGRSQSTIQVSARDANNQPVRGLSLRADIFVGGVQADLGTLSSKSFSTDNNGLASVVFTAPPAPPATASADTTVSVVVTPVGGNSANDQGHAVDIRLARPGVIGVPCVPSVCGDAPVAGFVFSPTQPREADNTIFDGSSSTGTIVSWNWTFGDGGSASGKTVSHTFALAGTYNVTLLVTDSFGRTASKVLQIVVIAGTKPNAAFTFSPTNPLASSIVNFNGSASSAITGRTIVSYDWDFGDGGTGGGVTTQHNYALPPGTTITVTLKVTDSAGQVGVASATIKFN